MYIYCCKRYPVCSIWLFNTNELVVALVYLLLLLHVVTSLESLACFVMSTHCLSLQQRASERVCLVARRRSTRFDNMMGWLVVLSFCACAEIAAAVAATGAVAAADWLHKRRSLAGGAHAAEQLFVSE